MSNVAIRNTNGVDLIEKVIIQNDFSGLTSLEKVEHIKNVCKSLQLNPLTKPIQLIRFEGKEVPYFTKDATEQLRKINHVSLVITEAKTIDDIYVVVVEASMPDGRKDSATGAVTIAGLRGKDKANAFMKAETKAKRRATLSICGLGFLDESEIESLPHAEPVVLEESVKIQSCIDEINTRLNVTELQATYEKHYKYFAQLRDKEALKKLIEAKDKKKSELALVAEFMEEMDDDNAKTV